MAGGPEGNKPSLSIDISDLITAVKNGNTQTAIIAKQLQTRLGAQSAVNSALASSYHISGGVLVSTQAGYLVGISIISTAGGTGTGLCYDSATVANAGPSNAVAVIPSSGFLLVNWPLANGLVVQPSSQGGHIVSVSYV